MANPNEVCTETFLLIGPFEDETSRNNCKKYIESKFFKFLLFLGKGTMHVTSSVFTYIPLQDFTDKSDVNWLLDENSLNKYLYSKYGFTSEEIQLIESKFM